MHFFTYYYYHPFIYKVKVLVLPKYFGTLIHTSCWVDSSTVLLCLLLDTGSLRLRPPVNFLIEVVFATVLALDMLVDGPPTRCVDGHVFAVNALLHRMSVLHACDNGTVSLPFSSISSSDAQSMSTGVHSSTVLQPENVSCNI